MRPIKAIEDGSRCTWFLPVGNPRTSRKQWIAASLDPAGAIAVDAGAAGALTNGKSLLPAGVVAVDGDFERGDAVIVRNHDGHELGRGLIA